MPVLLRSQLDRARESRTNLARGASSSLLRPTSFDNQVLYNGQRRESIQSAANTSRRTVVSVIDFHDPTILVHPTPKKRGLLPEVKLLYRRLHLNYLLPLVFMMFYMGIGSILFLWLEGPADSYRKAQEYGLYERERELLLKRLDEIYKDRASVERTQRRLFMEEAVDYFHEKINLVFSNTTDWSFTTALYYSGTVFTTIGLLLFFIISRSIIIHFLFISSTLYIL